MRRSFRKPDGKVGKETLANLSVLPAAAVDAIEAVLKGKTLVDAGAALSITRSRAHGHVALVHAAARQLGLPALLGPPCRERDLAYALIVSRVVAPRPKLATLAGGMTSPSAPIWVSPIRPAMMSMRRWTGC